jgi:excisionase family DNA binding protein
VSKNILSVPEAARYSSLSRVTLWKYVRAGDLKAHTTPGGHYRIAKEDLEAFMRKRGIYPLGTYQPVTTKILIVDDDLTIQKMLAEIMKRHGYQTEIATDGFEAGVKVMEFKPGLMILDLIMPGMDGFEVCRKIKGNPATSHIRVLAVSGYDTAENRDRIMEAGADCYLPKPLKSDLLLQNVRSLLNGAGNE